MFVASVARMDWIDCDSCIQSRFVDTPHECFWTTNNYPANKLNNLVFQRKMIKCDIETTNLLMTVSLNPDISVIVIHLHI